MQPALVRGVGTSWNLLNYAGDLFTADAEQAPLLTMIGGLTGGMMTRHYEFPTAVLFEYPEPEQPEISEMDSVTAPEPEHIARSQDTNVVQIIHETVDLTYFKQANSGMMSGLNTAGQQPNPASDLDWQIQRKLVKIARDTEHSFISGTYQKSTSSAKANKTRGLLELCSDATSIDAAGATLSYDLLKALYKEMADNGAYFENMVLFCNSAQKQRITDIYANQHGSNQPPSRAIFGVNAQVIQTDFFTVNVVWNRFMPQGDILIADIANMAPVFMEVPGKGVLFEEPLSKKGASDGVQIYGHIGLAHGPAFLHGTLTGLVS